MATSPARSAEKAMAYTDYSRPTPRQTSISAHIVQSIAITMSASEVDTLMGAFGRNYDDLSDTERQIFAEFAERVNELR